jgi:hypothetical protein
MAAMPAFRRRVRFAAPVVITVAASCSHKEAPKAKPFPGVTWSVSMQDLRCRAIEPGPNPPPPRAIECPPGMSGKTIMTVTELADHSCAVVPPSCKDVSCAHPKTACPLPFGKELVQKLAMVWIIEKRGPKCHAEEENEDCPPGQDCNPPAPRTFDCPPGVTEEKPLRIAELPDTTCVIVPDGCRDTSCATEKTACIKP